LRADIIGVTATMPLLGEALKIPGMVKEKDALFIIGGPGVMNLPSTRLYEAATQLYAMVRVKGPSLI